MPWLQIPLPFLLGFQLIGICLASTVDALGLSACVMLTFHCQQCQCNKEQDDAAGGSNGGFRDFDIAEDPRSAPGKEQHEDGCDDSALKLRAKLASSDLRLGQGRQGWHFTELVDHDEKYNEAKREA